LRIQILSILKNTEIEIITSIKNILAGEKLNVAIVPHENPDGDAIGSAIGLAEILTNYGHQVTIVSANDYPDFLKWFSSEVEIVMYDSQKKRAKEILKKSDVLVCVDFNEVSRAGKLKKMLLEFSKPKILIDHHPYPSYFCDYTISEPQYSSTAELIFDIIHQIDLEEYIEQNAAEALYTGILTDTGSFSHNTSRPNTFKVVSELVKLGIDTGKIQSGVYHNFSASRMKLLGYCLNEKMVVYPEYRAAVITISKKELDDFEFKSGDTEGFVNYPLSINNIVFSVLFIEKEGLVKASFRSKGNFPTNRFAKENFNGGGHLNASGGESKLSLEETLEKFTQLLPEFKHQLLETII
jgi:bifunctional oligoribonuclease and PAP phosphatase NrnA